MAARKGNGKAIAIGLGTAVAVGLGVALFSRDAGAAPIDSGDGSGGGSGEGITFPVYSGTQGADLLRALSEAEGLHPDWVAWVLLTARGESGFTSNVVLGDPALYPTGSVPSASTATLGPAEASGARTAYTRAREQGRLNCPWPESAYTWGTGGWLAQFAPNAWTAYEGTPLACRHPWYLLHPVDTVVTAVETLRRLSGWSAWKANPTMLTARTAWGNPSKMGDPDYRAKVLAGAMGDAEALGLPPSFFDRPLPPLPPAGDVYQRWGALMNAFNLPPGRIG